ncbi:MAG: trypsin-like peptidase domain-containing protein [Anaerolineae bacterium]|nr:trypsin-like peptidase domain-containing protein [Anaerolineae bacterium]
MGVLSKDQFQEFIEVLLDAYPIRDQLAQMFTVRLEKNINAISDRGNIETDIYFAILAAESQGWTYQFVNAVRESRPDNPLVIEFSQQFNLVSTQKKKTELERIIKGGQGFLDVAAWRADLGKAETRLCRIELPLNSGKMAYGTGFLVGPSTIMTNYHVIEPILKGQVGYDAVILRFDYKRLEDGTTLNQGTLYKLVEDEEAWCMLYSPYSQADRKEAAENVLPGENELDFALLRVKGKPANDRVGKVIEMDAPKRGYFEIPEPSIEIQSGEPLLILQHPEGDYLKLAIDTEGGLNMNANGTRLRYTTNTLKGSSGSPCFNINWKLVALHHAGDPNYSYLHKPQYNQGIPIGLIRAYIAQHDKFSDMES